MLDWKGARLIRGIASPCLCWVSYTGAVTTVLRERGIKCDITDVAGMSGYAFIVNIHPELLPTGPVAFDWEVLIEGTQALGIQTELVAVERGGDEGLFAELFTRVREEIDSGRCCIVWGASDAPEFGVVYGYNNDCYVVLAADNKKGGNQRQLIKYNEIKALWRIAAVFFNEKLKMDKQKQEQRAIIRAVKLLRGLHSCFAAEYHYGTNAFQTWSEAIDKGRFNPLGHTYNIMCYHELQMCAASFCQRLANRWNKPKEDLREAGESFRRSFERLEEIKRITPMAENEIKEARGLRTITAELLRGCARDNEQALQALERALGLM
ncbi:MAG: hypothetical protein ACUVUR_04550 [bacterium]